MTDFILCFDTETSGLPLFKEPSDQPGQPFVVTLGMVLLDPATLDVNGGYDCIYFTIATSSQATNFVAANAFLHTAYEQATPPSAILD